MRVLLLLLVACGPRPGSCGANDDCAVPPTLSRCVRGDRASAFCADFDGDCDSGWRFVEYAPAPFGGQCVARSP